MPSSREMRELGYVIGQNVLVEERGHYQGFGRRPWNGES